MTRRSSLLPGVACLLVGCATPPSPQLTYDRYDSRSTTYVNDTAGFAMVFEPGWRVFTDVDNPARLFNLLPVPTGSEVSVKAVTDGVGLWVETTRVPSSMPLTRLQPAILNAYREYFRQLRYQQLSLEPRTGHGIEYVEWIYRLSSPDRDDTMVEALFIHWGYAVRVRAKSSSENFGAVRERVTRLMESLTSLDFRGAGR
ncbi:MAG: hypothetical protein HY904_22205 [Deltaproteobacteria bacterium]|nr:hypothetical protein [Deltaproteobacteria bacterium]